MAIVFGPESPTFLAKSDIFIPKCTEGGREGGDPTVWEIFLKNASLSILCMHGSIVRLPYEVPLFKYLVPVIADRQ